MTHDWLSLANGVIPLAYWSNEVLAVIAGVEDASPEEEEAVVPPADIYGVKTNAAA